MKCERADSCRSMHVWYSWSPGVLVPKPVGPSMRTSIILRETTSTLKTALSCRSVNRGVHAPPPDIHTRPLGLRRPSESFLCHYRHYGGFQFYHFFHLFWSREFTSNPHNATRIPNHRGGFRDSSSASNFLTLAPRCIALGLFSFAFLRKLALRNVGVF